MKAHTEKFRKAGIPYAWSFFNLSGGSHHNKVMAHYNVAISRARDELVFLLNNSETANDFYLKVSPHLEGITVEDIITFQAEYINSCPIYHQNIYAKAIDGETYFDDFFYIYFKHSFMYYVND